MEHVRKYAKGSIHKHEPYGLAKSLQRRKRVHTAIKSTNKTTGRNAEQRTDVGDKEVEVVDQKDAVGDPVRGRVAPHQRRAQLRRRRLRLRARPRTHAQAPAL